MPYKDLERKKEWERLHRSERLARRRELRRITAAQQVARPDATGTEHSIAGLMIPMVAGGALAAYSPKLGMAAGGTTLGIAATFKKDWRGLEMVDCGDCHFGRGFIFLLGQANGGS